MNNNGSQKRNADSENLPVLHFIDINHAGKKTLKIENKYYCTKRETE